MHYSEPELRQQGNSKEKPVGFSLEMQIRVHVKCDIWVREKEEFALFLGEGGEIFQAKRIAGEKAHRQKNVPLSSK